MLSLSLSDYDLSQISKSVKKIRLYDVDIDDDDT